MKKLTNTVSILVLLLFPGTIMYAQTNEWTWIKGDSIGNSYGIYGTQDVASILNQPGARGESVSWADLSGNLWLFGGVVQTYDGSKYLNDLWKYNIATNEWTWMKGDSAVEKNGVYGIQNVAAPSNNPGSRLGCISWTDNIGNLWLFGGSGFAAQQSDVSLNDLWKYNIATNEWTWVSGDSAYSKGFYGVQGISSTSNKPRGRDGSIAWKDAIGNLWLFGGQDDVNRLNDLWKYNLSTNQWVWMKGDSSANEKGIYGIQGLPSLSNKPGARHGSIEWVDASNNFWLFGGRGYATKNSGSGVFGYLNDLWKYNIATNEWTWISGDSSINSVGIYGAQGVPSSSYKPEARSQGIGWKDTSNTLWLFGGTTKNVNANSRGGKRNDLWSYNVSTNQWTWVKGDIGIDNPSTYGTQGNSSISNTPGARNESIGWTDKAGNLWLFGGYHYNLNAGTNKTLNDLWKYIYRPSLYYFRTRQSGNWDNPSTWETSSVIDFSHDLISPATITPNSVNSNAVIVRNGHIVTVNTNVTSHQTTINTGGTLQVSSGITFIIVP